ncbi:MAG: carboxypeptidase-like regulatory domain-containing protein [Ferruginibacter sp.]
MRSLQNKWRCWCCLILVILSLPAYTQIDITGRVVDEKDDAPLPNASVYFNNTTIGTYTDQQGNFSFDAARLLNTDLVISCAGYDLLAYKPVEKQVEKKRIVFKLRASTELQNKMNLTEELRKKCLEIFYKSFLGVTKEANKCVVNNPGNIYFGRGVTNTGFVAYADTPLVVTNNALGYKISYNLVEFVYDDATMKSDLVGYTRYQEMGDGKKWARNRQNSYYGSTLHFYRSLIKNQLYEQGFGTFVLQPVTDSIQTSMLSDEQAAAAAEIVKTVPITAQEILYIDSSNNLSIRGVGRLLVQYSQDPASKEYLRRNVYVAGDLDKGVESQILFKTSPIGINISGVLSDASGIEYSGYWIYEKAANSLPYDYQPAR